MLLSGQYNIKKEKRKKIPVGVNWAPRILMRGNTAPKLNILESLYWWCKGLSWTQHSAYIFYTFNPHNNPLSGVMSLHFPVKKAEVQSALFNFSRSPFHPSLHILIVIILRINSHLMEDEPEFPLHFGWEHKSLAWNWCDLWWSCEYDLIDRNSSFNNTESII